MRHSLCHLYTWLLGQNLLDKKQAIELLVQQLHNEPDSPKVHYDLGNLLLESTNKVQESIFLLAKALELSKGHHDAFNALGNSFRVNGRFEEAKLCYLNAIIFSDTPERSLANLASYWAELGQFEFGGLFAFLSKMVDPEFPQASWLLAMHHLRHGHYDLGFPLMAKRAELDAKAVAIYDKNLPMWQGNYVPLLLQKEQGVGDFIQYARFIPQLAAKVPKLVVQIPSGMRELMHFNFPNVSLIEDNSEQGGKDLCARIPLFDLHRVLDIGPDMPVVNAYIQSPATFRSFLGWNQNLPRPWVGVVWSGNSMHKNDRNRSIAASEFAQIFNSSGEGKGVTPFKGTVISLQKKPSKENLIDHSCFNLIDISEQLHSWMDTAQALKQLDLLVSVDTAVAHLGAAMGVKTHILLARSPDWRWGIHQSHTFWYRSVVLHCQDSKANWQEAFAQIRREVE